MDNPTITKERRVINKFMVFGDRVHEIHTVVVHTFRMGDVEDPDLYAAQPLSDWQDSEAGKFVMAHAVETPYWIRQIDYNSYGHRYVIVARMRESDQTFFRLKFK